MTDPVNEQPEKKKRGRKKNGASMEIVMPPGVERVPPGTMPTGNEVFAPSGLSGPTFTVEQAKELASIAIQATRFGPNPGFLQGQPIALVQSALRESMPPEWRAKGADGWIAKVEDPFLQVIMLTFFASYWNLGYRIGLEHGRQAASKK
jgi:hypothetical protein